MMRLISALMAFFLSVNVYPAFAATVRFTLCIDGLEERFQLFAEELDGPSDNGGIYAYGAVLTGVATIDHVSPRSGFAQGPNGTGPAGFTHLRSADGVPILLAAQYSPSGGAERTPNLIYGFGQHRGSFAELGMSDLTMGLAIESPTWKRPLLIAKGTYLRAQGLPQINGSSVDTFASVFDEAGATSARPAVVQVRESDRPLTGPWDCECQVPEASACQLILFAAIGCSLNVRRRYKRR